MSKLPRTLPALACSLTPLCAAVLLTTNAAAQSSTTEPAQTLETVVVTAVGRAQAIKDAPASVTVITREELERLPATRLDEVVRGVEGLSVIGYSPNDRDISIRGLPGEYTLVLIDGKRMGTRETMNRGTGGVQSNLVPPLEAIERIEIVRGPMSSLYGSDAMGGVVNIITRRMPAAWHGSVGVDATLPEDSDEGGSRGAQFWIGGPLKADLVGLQVFGKIAKRSEDEIYYPGPLTSGANGTDDRSVTAKLSITPNRDHDIVLEAGGNDYSYERTPGKSIAATAAATETEHERRYLALTHNGRWQFGDSTIALQRETGKQRNWTSGVVSTVVPEVTNTVLDAQLALPFTQHQLKIGGQYNHAKAEGIGRQDSISGYPTNIDSVTVKSWALFAEDEYFITRALTLTGGLRLDHDERYGSNFLPRLYAVYKLDDRWTARAGVARGFKAPTIRQSTAGYCMTTGGQTGNVSPPGTLCGNPDLEPETSTTQEAGIRYDLRNGASAALTLFNNEFKNKIASYDTGAADPLVPSRNIYVYDNIDRVTLRGIESSVTWPLTPSLKGSANYTYTDSKRKGGGEPAFDGSSLDGQPLASTPKHMFNTQIDWAATDRLALYARAAFLGKSYYAGFRNGAMNTRERPSSTTLDLGGSFNVSKNLSLKAAVLNVADKKVDVDTRTRTTGLDGNWMVDEGRRLFVGLDARF